MLQKTDLLHALQSIPWLYELIPSQVEQLFNIAIARDLKAGEMLFEEGERHKELYILLEGQLSVEALVPAHGLVCIYTVEPLDLIGWSCLTPFVRQRTATARATLDCSLIAFDGKDLKSLCEQDHDLGYLIMRRMANVIASRMLSTRLQLYELLIKDDQEITSTSSQSII